MNDSYAAQTVSQLQKLANALEQIAQLLRDLQSGNVATPTRDKKEY
jgi:hypothetical protein